MHYRKCQHCGANLDPGEQCDCKEGDKANSNYNSAAFHNFCLKLRRETKC